MGNKDGTAYASRAPGFTPPQRLEKSKGAIKNGPFRDIGNIGHTRHRTKIREN
jgi:hypothetical protein